jgi:hypothetical protein
MRLLLALGVKVNPVNISRYLIETNVIKALEAGAGNRSHSMIWHEEVLLPAHEYVLSLRKVLEAEIWPLRLFCEGLPGRKAGPVLHVDFLIGAPFCMSSLKRVLRPNDFTLKVRRKRGMVVGETYKCLSTWRSRDATLGCANGP